ncbi:GNAT family N-acetyltransferase [Streptomyces sp. NPDC059740]|uniref:GNAT family N-acetyltransferase n=1 Tax=Streptomyces sp. NPDC059740 TaxID=3346926 RepID=UPI00365D7F4F
MTETAADRPTAPAHTLTSVRGDGDLTACHAVRREVFVREQGVAEEHEMDEYDVHAVHLLARTATGEAHGTARVLFGPAAQRKYAAYGLGPDTAVLGRLAVVGAARGTGLGATLVRAVEAEARRLGATEVYLQGQVQALGFYERLGYTAYGPEFDDGSGIAHRAMRRRVDA